MKTVQLFDTVSVSYTATTPSGEVVEQVPENKPITLTIGSGRILRAVEASLMNMAPGEIRTVQILPEDAFGPHHKELVHEIPRESFGDRLDPKPGMILSLAVNRDGDKQQVPATVLAANQKIVTVDYNHPLAGMTITYTVKVHGIAS